MSYYPAQVAIIRPPAAITKASAPFYTGKIILALLILPFFASSRRNRVMELYSYSKLKDSKNDIRLIELLPGVFDDKIKLRISHVALDPQFKQARQSSAAIEEVRRTLPPKCIASKTYKGQYIYEYEDGDERRTSWTHPDRTSILSRTTPGLKARMERCRAMRLYRTSGNQPKTLEKASSNLRRSLRALEAFRLVKTWPAPSDIFDTRKRPGHCGWMPSE